MAVTRAPAGVAQNPVDPQSQRRRRTSCAGEPTAPSAQRVPYGQSDGCAGALGTTGAAPELGIRPAVYLVCSPGPAPTFLIELEIGPGTCMCSP
ncbi:hypothetical protein PCANC_05643 [Puccinia coronata f. sp. avenae]|uniref:Uncharacterized protein n=1 Tax=Puccinia coronata f. sp. avenae TaxID=200324 RepID=A0A2N5VWY6_9BASI|nr:hypothetical protein PCANC_05643 [Puccinia coronata f. sp. avenae]